MRGILGLGRAILALLLLAGLVLAAPGDVPSTAKTTNFGTNVTISGNAATGNITIDIDNGAAEPSQVTSTVGGLSEGPHDKSDEDPGDPGVQFSLPPEIALQIQTLYAHVLANGGTAEIEITVRWWNSDEPPAGAWETVSFTITMTAVDDPAPRHVNVAVS